MLARPQNHLLYRRLAKLATGRSTPLPRHSRRSFSTTPLSSSSSSESSGNNGQQQGSSSSSSSTWSFRLGQMAALASVLTVSVATVVSLEDKPPVPTIDPNMKPLASMPLPTNGKKRVVVLGTGWASLAFINNIDLTKYEVVVVSPRNYFLFTPMLTAATVGSVEVRSICEPIRRILKRLSKTGTYYIEAECTDIVYQDNYVVIKVCQTPWEQRECMRTASSLRRHPTPEESAARLWTASNAPAILTNPPMRSATCSTLSLSAVDPPVWNLPEKSTTTSTTTWPRSSPRSSTTARSPSSKAPTTSSTPLTRESSTVNTEKEFGRSNIKTLCSSRVTEVQPNKLVVVSKADRKTYEMPFGMCLWATGVGPRPITAKLCDSIPEQRNNRAISTDVFLRVIGVPHKNVFAIGDCATVTQQRLLDHLTEVFEEADENHDDKLSIDELVKLVKNNSNKYPQLKPFIGILPEKFAEFDLNKDNFLQLNEFKLLIERIDQNLTTLPATAQVANQEGVYLAKAFNQNMVDPARVEPFNYRHLGSFAYIGHHNAVADIPGAFSGGGFGVWWAWRAVYLEKQFSWKNKMLVSLDWSKTMLFGRDISRI
uniref:Calcium-binding EF-hand domain-containing protein n=1 Tax=Rostrostelium ellipticum TaxID=361140 RepID=A0A1L2FV21_9MYCE|nr:calcium-binding EF-hand domain-containing protein [Rostrostelium ellipticum]